MSALTTRLSLYKPGGGSTGTITPDEVADIDKINQNMDLVDAAIGATICTSGTRPSSPYDGKIIYETDTSRFRTWRAATTTWVAGATTRGALTQYLVADLTALDAISDATLGDTAWMTAPGTGINPLLWVAWAGSGTGIDWRPAATQIVIAATKANLDTFVAAVAAIADTRFEVGALVFVTGTSTMYRFTVDVGTYRLFDTNIIVPTSVAGSGVTFDTLTGLVTCVAATTASLNGIFATDSTGIDDYEVVLIKTAASTANVETWRLRLSGTDAATNYDVISTNSNNNAGTFATTLAATSVTINGGTGVTEITRARIFMPALAQPTWFESNSTVTPNPFTAAATAQQLRTNLHRDSTAYDGITVIPNTGTVTCIIYVRKRR